MLTALSVARECGMVDKTDRIILVQAYPQQDSKSQPVIEFVYADDRETKVQEVMTMVRFTDTQDKLFINKVK